MELSNRTFFEVDAIYNDSLSPLERLSYLLHMLLVHLNHFLHLIIAAHENARSVVNMFGYDGEHTFHSAVNRLAAS